MGDVVNVGGLRGEKQFVSVGNDVGRGRWLLGGGINAHRLMLSFIRRGTEVPRLLLLNYSGLSGQITSS